MFLVANIPIHWFNDDLSKSACKKLSVRVIKTSDWLPLEKLYSIALPQGFDVATYIGQNKIHAIYFKSTESTDVIIHPDALFKIGKREVKRRIKRERLSLN